jgi:transcriptional regulator with XRE-family HTH domain
MRASPDLVPGTGAAPSRGTARGFSGIRLEAQLRALRRKRGLSQAQAARLAGVSRPYLAKIESGRTTSIGLNTLIRVVTGLGGRLRIGVEARPAGPRPAGRRRAATVATAELFAPVRRTTPLL